MSPEHEPVVGWTPPVNYYPEIAVSEVSGTAHLLGRMALGAFCFVRFGRPVIIRDPGFVAMKDQIAQGNVIAAPVHRADLDTVLLPSVLERVGIHHARPMSKLELFQNRVVRWGMHKLGGFAVDRKNVDNAGLAIAQSGILRRADSDLKPKKRFGLLKHLGQFKRKPKNGNVTIYPEATRIHQDVKKVATIKHGAVKTALQNGSLLVPIGFAGLSKEKIGKKPYHKTISRDKPSWFGRKLFGRGRRLVFAVGAPIRPTMLQKEGDESDRRTLARSVSFWNDVLHNAIQQQLDLAYAMRGSSQEEVFDVPGDVPG